jgi:hypothetical protein
MEVKKIKNLILKLKKYGNLKSEENIFIYKKLLKKIIIKKLNKKCYIKII